MPEPGSTVQIVTEAEPNAAGDAAEANAAPAGGDQEGSIVPAGIMPLFFSGAGQQIFQCVVDQDVSPESPFKLIPKEKILEDFTNRAAVSDFHPVKKKVQAYAGDEILLVYDHDFKYGENFYICVTEDAKELILNPPEVEVEGAQKDKEEEEEDEIPKTPIPKRWECLGSDLEIKEGQFEDKGPRLKYSIYRKRIHFEFPCTFTDCLSSSNPDNCLDIFSHENPNYNLFRMEMEMPVQAISEMVDESCQTERLRPCNKAIQYSPQELSPAEAEATMSHENMKEFVNQTIPRVEACLQQNWILNMFEDDYKLLSEMDGITGKKSDATLKEYQSFTDLRFSKNKVITQIEWHPTIKGIIAVSCGENLSFDERVDLSNLVLKKQSLLLVWSFTDPIHPVLFLEAPDNILCFKFNPTNPNLVVGGCSNGQLILWNIEEHRDCLQINKNAETSDSRATAANLAIFDTDPKLDHAPMVQYCVTSSIKDGHSREVSDVQWLPHSVEICQKTGSLLDNPSHQCNQVISCSIDGSVFIWDLRQQVQKGVSQISGASQEQQNAQPYAHLDLTWKPLVKVPMSRLDLPGKFSAKRVSIREKHTELPKGKDIETLKEPVPIGQGSPIDGANTMFFAGTEDGEVVYCDWKPTKDSESGKFTVSPPAYYFNAHSGPISCVNRSPFFRDILLTVGGCTWALWKEGAQSGCLFSSACSSVPMTGGAWSPTRPGVFFIIKANGNVDVWDLMDRSHEGLLTQNISSVSLTSIYPWQLTAKQLMLAVGDSGGTLHILEIPWNLSHPSSNEVSIMENFFHRQVERLEFTADRMAKRAVEKKDLDAEKLEEKVEKVKAIGNWEEKAKKDYTDYLDLELKLLIELGVVQPDADRD